MHKPCYCPCSPSSSAACLPIFPNSPESSSSVPRYPFWMSTVSPYYPSNASRKARSVCNNVPLLSLRLRSLVCASPTVSDTQHLPKYHSMKDPMHHSLTVFINCFPNSRFSLSYGPPARFARNNSSWNSIMPNELNQSVPLCTITYIAKMAVVALRDHVCNDLA